MGRGLIMIAAVLATTARAEGDIADNSFLVEEAYNQEAGVVQHIQTFSFRPGAPGWAYSFTQEWPAPDEVSQLSITVPVLRVPSTWGLGDVMLNYRRELLHSEDDRVVFTSRVSLWVPTGNLAAGLGDGVFGVQAAALLSLRPVGPLATHSNLGFTIPFTGTAAAQARLQLAQSLIWLLHRRFNLMLELAYNRAVMAREEGGLAEDELYLSPGARMSFDLPGGLQLVPGVAVPIGAGPSSGQWSLLLYFSIEHPFSGAGLPPEPAAPQ